MKEVAKYLNQQMRYAQTFQGLELSQEQKKKLKEVFKETFQGVKQSWNF